MSSKQGVTEGGGSNERAGTNAAEGRKSFVPSSKVPPFSAGGLPLNKRLEVELRVELIRLCAGVGEDPLLVEFFGNLNRKLPQRCTSV
jgi:hypothetical protein